ncbi:MAG: hypothetical protein AAB875_00530, partial [Patescibacteria group bacterium]
MPEGTFPKVNGDIFYASEVNKFGEIGISLLNFCNTHKYFDYTNNISGLSFGNAVFEGFGNDDRIDYNNTTLVVDNEDVGSSITKKAYVANVLDNFNNSSLNVNIWT